MTKFKTLDDIWAAIENGKTVYWQNRCYKLTVEDSQLQWRKENGMPIPWTNKNGRCLRVTCTKNYFGSLLLESEVKNLFTVGE